MVNFINITIFSVEALPWNLIVQDHWRWGLSTDHIVGRVWLSCHLEWGVCFVSKQLASTSFRRQVQRWRGLSGNVRLSNLLISSCWSFLSNTKNGANFNLPAPYGRITIHEKLSASGRRGGGGGEANPWQGLCPWITWGLRLYPPSYGIYGWMTLAKMWVQICLYCSNCTKFGQLILRKIIKMVATRCRF